MNPDPQPLCAMLREYSRESAQDPHECSRLLSLLNYTFTAEQFNASLLEVALIHLLDESEGLPGFITGVMNRKPFKKSTIAALEIIFTLINNFPFEIEKFAVEICKLGLAVMKSLMVEYEVKTKALEVLNLCFLKVPIPPESHNFYTEVYRALKHAFHLKKSDSVQEKILIAMGTFAKKFPFLVEDHGNLRSLLLSQLDMQMAQKKLSYKMLSGLFEGLTGFCESYPLNPEVRKDQEDIARLYKHIDKMAAGQNRIKVDSRAALTFLSKNINLFSGFMVKDYKRWHNVLLQWLDYGAEDCKVGFLALKAFYQGLSTVLLSNPNPEQDREVTLYFLAHFKAILNDTAASSYHKRSVLCGLQSFSEVSYVHLRPEQVTELFIALTQTLEETYIRTDHQTAETLDYLPDYINTVASFMHFKKITGSEIFCLQRGVVALVKAFPQLSVLHRDFVVDTLVFTLHCMRNNDEKIFSGFLENVVYQGVVWTCSHQHVSEAEMLEEGSDGIVTIKNYAYLWKGLLRIKSAKKYDDHAIFLQDRSFLLVKIVDKLIRTLLILINKLNVSITLTEDNEALTDIQSTHKVANVNDFAIFLNVVDFYQDILDNVDPKILHRCILKLVQHIVTKCEKFSFISGFYKLLASCLGICGKLNCFGEEDVRTKQDVVVCYETLTRFLHTLLTKTRQFKDDLLISCLQVLLEYPITIIKEVLPACTPAFKSVFHIGRKCPRLAEMGITTLEKWQSEIPASSMEPFLVEVVPHLDSYLQSKSFGTFTQASVEKRKTAKPLKKRKVLLEVEPELVQLQRRILNFIGQQSSQLCKSYAAAEYNIELAVYGSEEHLKVGLPYDEIKLDLYLDKLIPRIVNLALNCSDRKTRIVACEVLQGVVMVFLGTAKQKTSSVSSDLDGLLKKMALPLMQLASDLDQVVQQLFQPLFFQLIHWYTHPGQVHKGHTAIVIDTILEGIVHPTDSALRDFSGKCINEYVKWTIKQSSTASLERDSINIKLLVNKMRFYSSHPDSFKKMGAALIFNSIYRELREETPILSMYWVELTYIFVKSILTTDRTSENENVALQIDHALSHLQRGFVEKHAVFNSSSKSRRVPSDINGDLLEDLVVWILLQTGSKSPFCRQKCMELFCGVAPFTKGFRNLPEFTLNHLKKEGVVISNIFEGFLVKHPTIAEAEGDDGGKIKWIQAFLCALDGCNFVVKNNILRSPGVFSGTFKRSLEFFVSAALSVLADVQGLKAFEREELRHLQRLCILKVLELLNLLLLRDKASTDAAFILNRHFWNLLLNLVFNPQTLGFNPHYIKTQDNSDLFTILTHVLKKLPDDKAGELAAVLKTFIEQNLKNVDLQETVPLQQRNIIKGLLFLQSSELKNLGLEEFRSGIVEGILKQIMDGAANNSIYATDFPDSTLQHCLLLLEFALADDSELISFVNYLYMQYEVYCSNSEKPVRFGVYVLDLFEDAAIPKLLAGFELFLEAIKNRASQIGQSVDCILHVVNQIGRKKELKQHGEAVVTGLFRSWGFFEKYLTGLLPKTEQVIEFAKCLTSLGVGCSLRNEEFVNWLIGLLVCRCEGVKQNELDFKVEVFYLVVDVLNIADDRREDLSAGLTYLKNEFFTETSTISREIQLTAFDKMMSYLPKVRLPQILKFTIDLHSALALDSNENYDLNPVLSKYIASLDEATQQKCLSEVYDMCLSGIYSDLQKYGLLIRALPLFHHCHLKVFERFCVEHIAEMMGKLQESAMENNLVQKIASFVLVEVIFLRFDIVNSDSEAVPLVQAAVPEKASNKRFLLLLLKSMLNVFKDVVAGNPDVEELVRLYKCHGYNALASVISNSLKDQNLIAKLFVRQEGDREVLWSSLVDTNKVYTFEADFDAIPKKKKVLVNIRDELKQSRVGNKNHTHSIKYMESQRLQNSSLCEDLAKFDFTTTVVRSQNFFDNDDQNGGTAVFRKEIELDSVDVNNHECMAVVCGLIEHLVKVEDEENLTMPVWMKGIKALLMSEDTHTNVKIFWVKVIYNTMDTFRHFARHFLEPLLKFVVDKCAGNEINYFVSDVVSVLISWANNAVPIGESEIQLVHELLHFLVSKIDNERQDIFKYHLELIKLIVEAWKPTFKVPYDALFSRIDVDPTSRKSEIGIHFASIFLANGIAPWDTSSPVHLQKFCGKLFTVSMKNTYRVVYRAAAETIGLVLRFASSEQSFGKILENVNMVLKKMDDHDKYANSLEAIVLNYPEVMNEFHLTRVIARIESCPLHLKSVYLRIVLKSNEIVEEVSDFKALNWSGCIESEEIGVQVLALEVVFKYLDTMENSQQFLSLMKTLERSVSSPSVICRGRVYDIAMALIQRNGGGKNAEDVLEICKDILVSGLIDVDTETRHKIFQFWETSLNMPSQLTKRLPYILTNLYKTNTETDFLGYSTYFLLSSIKDTEAYEETLFENPLEDCTFEEYMLQTNWRARNTSMAPLFVSTLQSMSLSDGPYKRDNFDELRATQAHLTFAPTPSVRPEPASQYTMTQSSLYVKAEEEPGVFLDPNLVEISDNYKVPKRRFLKDRSKIVRSIIHHGAKKSVKAVEKRRDMVKESENKVTLYRKYRRGDLPDVQITLGALLGPLQVLGLHDSEVSRMLYLALFNGIRKVMESSPDFTESLVTGVRHIFQSSVQYNTTLFRTLLDMVISNKSSMLFEPELVARVCQSSGLISVGTLLLEEYIISYDDQPSTSKRNRGGRLDGEADYWVKLAELYREIEEWDIVRSIFVQKLHGGDNASEALSLEAKKQWLDAQESYRDLINMDASSTKKDFYYESYFKCFAHLGEWDKLSKAIEVTVLGTESNSWEVLWDQEWNQQKVLSWYINANLKDALFTQKSPDAFLLMLNDALKRPDRSEYLQNTFSEEMCTLWLFQREIGTAKQYLSLFNNNFLERWQLLDPLYFNLRYDKLLKLRNVVDISKFISTVQNLNLDGEAELKSLKSSWTKATHESLPTILHHETKVLYRKQFIDLLKKRIDSIPQGQEWGDLVGELVQTEFKLGLNFIDAAIEEGNYYMARKYCIRYGDRDDLEMSLALSKLGLCKYRYMRSSGKATPEQELDVMLQAVRSLDPILEDSGDPSLRLAANVHLFDSFQAIADILKTSRELIRSNRAELMEIMQQRSIADPDEAEVYGSDKLRSFIDSFDLRSEENATENVKAGDHCRIVGESYMKLAYFAGRTDNFANFLLFVLRAMKLDSSEARQLFPCILVERSLAGRDKEVFLEESREIPVWMFLGWIPQLLVSVDSPNISVVAPIILKIAKTYPQAIMYSYRLSKENYTFKDDAVKKEANGLIAQLDELLLNDERIDRFLTALSNVGIPESILLYYVQKIYKACSLKDMAGAKKVHANVMERFFTTEPNSKDANNMQGNAYKVLKSFKNTFQGLLNKSPSEIGKTLQALDLKLRAILAHMKKGNEYLKDYCPWLFNFSSDSMSLDLEVPGQYDGRRMPLTQHHVKISSFCPAVAVMSSLRKPIKITLLGSDTKEYSFLVKFGEDIRQDQRIQQLFTLMNTIFDNDKTIANRGFSIMTYQVVPLTSNLGIIEWVDSTTSLQAFMKKSIKDVKVLKELDQLSNRYVTWMSNNQNRNQTDVYGTCAQRYSRDKVITYYRSLVNMIPWDILRTAFRNLSANTESFVALQRGFVKSYASMCLCHWLLGIGDRHLENTKICTRNGKVLGIDFGHAFGTATTILPIPELVPFRLTPHIVNLMEPLGEKGLFREVMVTCLRSLRENRSPLLATMDVFVKEPTIDWLEYALRCVGAQKPPGTEDSPSQDEHWYPALKIQEATRKLEGSNSAAVMVRELQSRGRGIEKYVDAYIKLARGSAEFDVRARKQDGGLSVEDQVDCLLDHATDYNLLGRMYQGWTPWM